MQTGNILLISEDDFPKYNKDKKALEALKSIYTDFMNRLETVRRLRDMGMSDNSIHRAANISFDDLRML